MADMAMMEAVAREYGIALYRRYTTEQAAEYLGKAAFTLKRWRSKRELLKRGKPHALRVTPMDGRIYYMGIDIVEFMILRRDNPGVDDEPAAAMAAE